MRMHTIAMGVAGVSMVAVAVAGHGGGDAAAAPTMAEEPLDESFDVTLTFDQSVLGPDDRDAVAMVEITAPETAGERGPVTLALVLDVSGSMAGNKLDNARAAARRLVDELAVGDRLILVPFADEASPPRVVEMDGGWARSIAYGYIDALAAGGATCLSCGLVAAGAEMARAGATAGRVVVMSDGHANEGAIAPEALRALVVATRERLEVHTSTIGLGRDHSAHLLEQVSLAGGGGFYFVHNSAALEPVLRRELDLLARSVATDVEVVLHPMGDARLAAPVAAAARVEGAMQVISLGPMAAGERRRVVADLQLPDAPELSDVLLVDVVVVRPDGRRGRTEVAGRLERSDDPAVVEASTDARVRLERAQLRSSSAVRHALQRFEAGERDEALAALSDEAERLDVEAAEDGLAPLAAESTRVADLAGTLTAHPAAAPVVRGSVYLEQAYANERARGVVEPFHAPDMYDLAETE